MEYAILSCCVATIVLLIVLLTRSGGGDASRVAELEQQISIMRESVKGDNSRLMEQVFRQGQDTVTTVINLGKGLNEGQDRQQEAYDKRLIALEEKFDNIRRDMLYALEKIRQDNAASLEKLRADNQTSLDRINETVNEKLQKTLNDRITQSFELVNRRLTEVYEGLGEMKNVASGVSDLKNVLSNVKNRGTMGEIQLAAILDDILTPAQYVKQFEIAPNVKVDFAVTLPGPEDGEPVYLPIDSKFPGDKWSAVIAAYDSGDPKKLEISRKELQKALNDCAKSIHDKYIVPPRSTEFAVMFLPFEGLYAEAVNTPGLVESLQRNYWVNITGPSTMAAMLNSLRMGFQALAVQKKSGEVWKILGAAKTEFGRFEAALTTAQKQLHTVEKSLDTLIGTRTNQIQKALRAVSELDDAENAADLLELP